MWLSTWTDWAIFFIIVQIIHFLGTWKLYIAAGRKAWEAAIPGYNAVVMLDIIKRPKWWVILLFLPIISPIMILVLWVDFIRSYGKRGIGDAFIVILTLGFYIYYLNYVEKPDYTGPEDRKETFISAILFAVVLATTIHTFFVQPMIIPTGSMENTLRVGDALFVSKNIYGTRLPNTPVAVPFSDLFSRKMYLKQLQLPYERIPGWSQVKRNDIVVFNFPQDSILKEVDGVKKYVPWPEIDRKENYVKRCVGIPGDIIQVKDGILYVNNKEAELPKDALVQSSADFIFKNRLSEKYLQEEFGLLGGGDNPDYLIRGNSAQGVHYLFLGITDTVFETLKNNPSTVQAIQAKAQQEKRDGVPNPIFPKENRPWNRDWYGPLEIPKKGETVDLTTENISQYRDIITKFEYHQLEEKDGKFIIDGKETNSYTFGQNYYFMMGDNRHNSVDSRYFGYVPETHIIGKPFFLWANLNQIFGFEQRDGFRFNRWFTNPNSGDPDKTSYLPYFVGLLAIYLGWDYWRKRKKKKEA